MKQNDNIVFYRDGKRIEGRILVVDADPRAKIWVVDAKDPDVDYMVAPEEIEAPSDSISADAAS